MTVSDALVTVEEWLAELIAFFANIYDLIGNFLRSVLMQAGVPYPMQTIVIVVVDVLFILAVFRIFGGVFRILLMLFLILLIVHMVLPGTV